MSYIYRSVNIGQSSTPTADLLKVNTIVGLALAKGDTADSSGTTLTANSNQGVGWANVGPYSRYEAIMILPQSSLATYMPRNARILTGTLKLNIIARTMGSVVPTGGTNFVQVWAVRRAINASFTGLTWTNYVTGTPWAELGILFGTGADTDSARLDRFEFTQADLDANPGVATPVVKDINLTSELQRAMDFGEPLQLALKAEWAGSGTSTLVVYFSQPSGDAANMHSYLEIGFRRPRELYQSDASGNLDQTGMLDATSESLLQHAYLGAVSKGTSGASEKYFVRNEMTTAQPAITVQSGRVAVGSIDNSGVVGSGRVLCVRGYDYVAGVSATPTGVHRFVFTSATLYDHKFTPEGTTSEATVSTGNDITTDETLQYAALNALLVKSVANGGSVGTFAAADVVTFETRGDLHTTSFPKANLDDFWLLPHANNDRTTGNSSKQRSAANAHTCQLNHNDTRVIANSTGSTTGVIGDVTDGGSFTHIKVPDPTLFVADGYATLATYNSAGDPSNPGSGERVEHVQIKTVYDINDATYPGQIRLYEDLATVSDFDETSVFTSGVWIGTLEPADQQTLAVVASVASPVITLSAALVATSGTLTLLDLATGQTEDRTIASVSGVSVTLTAVPSYAYPSGSLVFFKTETTSNRPFFAKAIVPAAATKGRKRAYLSSESWAIV